MDDQNKNLLLATSLSFLVLLGWMLMFPPEPIEEVPSEQTTEQVTEERSETGTGLSTPVQVDSNQKSQKNVDVSSDAPRVIIETARLSGSLSLKGGKIDNLKLLDYFEKGSKSRYPTSDYLFSICLERLRPLGPPFSSLANAPFLPATPSTTLLEN